MKVKSVIAIDISPKMIEKVKERLEELKKTNESSSLIDFSRLSVRLVKGREEERIEQEEKWRTVFLSPLSSLPALPLPFIFSYPLSS
jgi:SAM-dependent methyltransferase